MQRTTGELASFISIAPAFLLHCLLRDRDESRDASREKLRTRDRNVDSNDYATITPAPQVVASKVQEAFSDSGTLRNILPFAMLVL